MKKRDPYFIKLIVGCICLIFLCIFSIIFASVNGDLVSENKATEHMMSFVYLFVHLIVVLFATYSAIKAYFLGSAIIKIVMTQDDETKNPKAYKNALIVGVVMAILGIYFLVNLTGIIPFMNFFSLGLNLALANVFVSISTISFFLFSY